MSCSVCGGPAVQRARKIRLTPEAHFRSGPLQAMPADAAAYRRALSSDRCAALLTVSGTKLRAPPLAGARNAQNRRYPPCFEWPAGRHASLVPALAHTTGWPLAAPRWSPLKLPAPSTPFTGPLALPRSQSPSVHKPQHARSDFVSPLHSQPSAQVQQL